MSTNDYIAEYIKERHPNILRMEFTIWKMAKMFKNGIEVMAKALKAVSDEEPEDEPEEDPEDIKAAGDEEDEDPDDENEGEEVCKTS